MIDLYYVNDALRIAAEIVRGSSAEHNIWLLKIWKDANREPTIYKYDKIDACYYHLEKIIERNLSNAKES